MDLAPAFAEKPAIHRFPGAMAERVRELAQVVAGEYGGDASRIWSEAKDGPDLKKRIGALPGFGDMKIKSLGAVLAKQFGVKAAEELAPAHPTLGDVKSPEELERYQEWKRAYKKPPRVPETPEAFWERVHASLTTPPLEEWDTWPFVGRPEPRELAPPEAADRPRHGEGGVGAISVRTTSTTRSGTTTAGS